MDLFALALAVLVSFGRQQAAVQKPAQAYTPTSSYVVQDIEGWKVLVNPDLLGKESELGKRALKELDVQLYEVARHMPAPAVEKLRTVKLWLEISDPPTPCAAYHPNRGWLVEHGINPDKAKCVEISNASTFVNWTLVQPAMIMHELSHAYHDQFVEQGFQNPEVLKCYNDAVKSGTYDAVWQMGSRAKARAYALTNQMEYFGEVSEAYYGQGDWFPFNRIELKEYDPEAFKMVAHLWDIGAGTPKP